MVRPLWFAASAVAVIACLAPASAADELIMKPELKAGQEMKYSLAMALDVTQTPDGAQPVRSSVRAGATVIIRVAELLAEGAATITVEFPQAAVKLDSAGTETGFEWPAPGLPADATDIQKLGSILGGSKVQAKVDAKGEVIVTGGLESFNDAVTKLGSADERIRGFFTNEKLASALTPIFRVNGAADAPRSVGKGWQTTETVALPPLAAIDLTADLSVIELVSPVASYGGGLNISLRTAENRPADAPLITLAGGGGAITGSFDLQKKIALGHRISMNIETAWTLGNERLLQNQMTVVSSRLLE